MLFSENILKQEKLGHIDQKIFSKLFPTGTIKEVKPEVIPGNAMDKFNHESLNFISDESNELKKEFFAIISHANGDSTYISQVIKTYDPKQLVEAATYLVDVQGGIQTGYGEIRKNVLDTGFNKPFVGFTETQPDFQKKGLGERRILLMNALSQSMYHEPIYSDELLRPKAEAIWLRLCGINLAEKIQTGKSYRYVFKKGTN